MRTNTQYDVVITRTPPTTSPITPLSLGLLKACVEEYSQTEVKAIDFLKYKSKFDSILEKKKRKIKTDETNLITDLTLLISKSISGYHSFWKHYLIFMAKINEGFLLDLYLRLQYWNDLLENENDKYDREMKSLMKKIVTEILSYGPKIVGFSTMNRNVGASLNIAKMIKKEEKDMKIVFGGVSTFYGYKELLKNYNFIDFCVVGEGERSFPKLVDNSLRNSEKYIPGVAYRKNKHILFYPNTKCVDLNDIPYPNWDDLDLKRYIALSIDTQRGCTRRCHFCNLRTMLGENLRVKTPERVANEVEFLKEKYGINKIYFCDNDLNAYPKRSVDISRCLVGKEITWVGNHFPKISAEEADWLKRGGCRRVLLGIESLNNQTLKKMNKNINTRDILITLKNLEQNGIKTLCYLLLGFPGEGLKDALKTTINVIRYRKFMDTIALSTFVLSYNSNVYRYPNRFGIRRTKQYGDELEKIYQVSSYEEERFLLKVNLKHFLDRLTFHFFGAFLNPFKNWEDMVV